MSDRVYGWTTASVLACCAGSLGAFTILVTGFDSSKFGDYLTLGVMLFPIVGSLFALTQSNRSVSSADQEGMNRIAFFSARSATVIYVFFTVVKLFYLLLLSL
jgi:hypothetical protein